jgi:hypothetical protein
VAPKAVTTPATRKLAGLPVMVATPTDLGRLIRELEVLDQQLLQDGIRGAQSSEMPRTSRLMEQTLRQNKINILDAHDRQLLLSFLETIKAKAPVLHMSFSADPPAPFLEKIMTWLRREIHPLVLISIGLQPNLGAGCIVRSTNKYFDLSLRQDFIRKRDLLKEAIVKGMQQPTLAEQSVPHPINTEGESLL